MNLKTILTACMGFGLALSAQAQTFTTGISAYGGTRLVDSSGNNWSNYTLQVGVFTGSMPITHADWRSWDNTSAGANAGWSQLYRATGSLTDGVLLAEDGYFANFSNTLPATGVNATASNTAYASALAALGDAALASAVFTRSINGYVEEVLVATFTTGLLGWDPDSIDTENIFGLTNEADLTTYGGFGSASGSFGSTVLTSATAIPEPSSLSLLVGGLVALLAARRRQV